MKAIGYGDAGVNSPFRKRTLAVESCVFQSTNRFAPKILGVSVFV